MKFKGLIKLPIGLIEAKLSLQVNLAKIQIIK
jgi:hypothetical protein